jgi:hypothetical protein
MEVLPKNFPKGLRITPLLSVTSFTIYYEENQAKYFKSLKKVRIIGDEAVCFKTVLFCGK